MPNSFSHSSPDLTEFRCPRGRNEHIHGTDMTSYIDLYVCDFLSDLAYMVFCCFDFLFAVPVLKAILIFLIRVHCHDRRSTSTVEMILTVFPLTLPFNVINFFPSFALRVWCIYSDEYFDCVSSSILSAIAAILTR